MVSINRNFGVKVANTQQPAQEAVTKNDKNGTTIKKSVDFPKPQELGSGPTTWGSIEDADKAAKWGLLKDGDQYYGPDGTLMTVTLTRDDAGNPDGGFVGTGIK